MLLTLLLHRLSLELLTVGLPEVSVVHRAKNLAVLSLTSSKTVTLRTPAKYSKRPFNKAPG